MNICVIARGIPGPGDPTLGIFELDQARALADAGHRVIVAALDVRSSLRRRRLGVYRTDVDGVDVVVVSLPVGAVGPGGTVVALSAAWRLAIRKVQREWGHPDVVHAHFSRFGAAVGARLGEAALIVTEHSSTLDGRDLPSGVDAVNRAAYAAADAVLAVSPRLVEVLRERYGVEARYVPNVVDVTTFAPRRSAQPTVGGGVRLVSVGNLIPRKRMELLLDGWARSLNGTGAELRIVGDGPQRPLLEARVRAGLADVELLGTITREEIAAELADADGFVLFSAYETFGVVYAEAMASGIPVLASRCGGPESFVTPDVGMLTDAATPAAAAQALTAFADALATYDHAAIRRAAIDQFSPAVIAAQLTRVYQEVLLADR